MAVNFFNFYQLVRPEASLQLLFDLGVPRSIVCPRCQERSFLALRNGNPIYRCIGQNYHRFPFFSGTIFQRIRVSLIQWLFMLNNWLLNLPNHVPVVLSICTVW